MNYTNLVFEGGGVLGIAYLGVLKYLYDYGIIQSIQRAAGTSVGAITACLTSFSLPFDELKLMADSLNYSQVPQKAANDDLTSIPGLFQGEAKNLFEDIDCLYRLVNDYGWYSSEYIYEWLQSQIASQFDKTKKLPPYTFEDFKNPSIHKDERSFLDLYVIGTDISTTSSKVFCFETTPKMEVAKAVRISMSIPLYFETIRIDMDESGENEMIHIFSDGGIMRNYPINIFDSDFFNEKMVDGANIQTLGAKFMSSMKYSEINNLIEYIENLVKSFHRVQQDMYNHSPKDRARSIEIDTGDVSFTDFNIKPGDETYNFLYNQGYNGAKNYFQSRMYYPRFYLI